MKGLIFRVEKWADGAKKSIRTIFSFIFINLISYEVQKSI